MFIQTHFQRSHRHHNTSSTTSSSSNSNGTSSQAAATRAAACPSSAAAAATSAAAANHHPSGCSQATAETTVNYSSSNNDRGCSPSQLASVASAATKTTATNSKLESATTAKASARRASAVPAEAETSLARAAGKSPRARATAQTGIATSTATAAWGEPLPRSDRSRQPSGAQVSSATTAASAYRAGSGNAPAGVRQRGRLRRSENSIGGGEGSFVSQRRRQSESPEPEFHYLPVEDTPIEEVGRCCAAGFLQLIPPPLPPPRQLVAADITRRDSQQEEEEEWQATQASSATQEPATICHWCAEQQRASSCNFESATFSPSPRSAVVSRQAYTRKQRQQFRRHQFAGSGERSILQSLLGAPLRACRSLGSCSLLLAPGRAPALEGGREGVSPDSSSSGGSRRERDDTNNNCSRNGQLALLVSPRRHLGLAAAFCLNFVAYQLETWLLLAGAPAAATTSTTESAGRIASSPAGRSRLRSSRHQQSFNQRDNTYPLDLPLAPAMMMPPTGAAEAQATFYRQLAVGADQQQSTGSQCLCRYHRYRRELFCHQRLLDDIQDSALGDSINDTTATMASTATDQLGYLVTNYSPQSRQQYGGDFHRLRSSTIGADDSTSMGRQRQLSGRRPHCWPTMPSSSSPATPWPPLNLVHQQQQANYWPRATVSVGGHQAAMASPQSSGPFQQSPVGAGGGSLPSSSINHQANNNSSSGNKDSLWHWNSNSESLDFSLDDSHSMPLPIESDSSASAVVKPTANAATAAPTNVALLAGQRQQQHQVVAGSTSAAACSAGSSIAPIAGYGRESPKQAALRSLQEPPYNNSNQQNHHYRESATDSPALARLIQQHSQSSGSRQLQRHLHRQQHSLQHHPQPQGVWHQCGHAYMWPSESQAQLGSQHLAGASPTARQQRPTIASDSELYARYRQPIMATAAAVIKPFQVSSNLERTQANIQQQQQRRHYEHANSAESPGERESRNQRRQQQIPVASKSTDSAGHAHSNGGSSEQRAAACTSQAPNNSSSSSNKLLTAGSTPTQSAKKAASLGKLSLAGARRRLGFKKEGLSSLSVQRSEEIVPLHASHLVRQMTANSLTDSGNESGSYWLSQSQTTQSSPDPRACFVEGLGVGQIASRQALVSPYLGDIQLSLSDRRGMLEVEVVRARHLQAKTEAKTLPSPYVKVYLMRNKKCVGKFKTSTARKTLDPLYQQLFTFRDDYTGCVLQAIVWGDYGKKDKKSLMGIVQIHLNDLDISNVVIGWYKLFNAPSMASSVASSKALRQTILTSRSVECQC